MLAYLQFRAPPGDVAVPNNPVSAMASTPAITVGGLAVQYVAGSLTPGSVGVYQIAVKLPANLPNGDQPLKATIGGVSIPDGVFLNIQK